MSSTSSSNSCSTTIKTQNERIESDRKFVEREFIRMGFDKDDKWRISDINKKFELCNTYPRFLIIPSSFKDDDLELVAKFRYFRRVPTAVWRHLRNGCFIVRSSQPTVGWFGWFRSELDESLVQSYVNNTMPPYSESTTSATTTTTTTTTTTATAATTPKTQTTINSSSSSSSSNNNRDESVDNNCSNNSENNDHSDLQQQPLADIVHDDGDKDNSNNNQQTTASTLNNSNQISFPNDSSQSISTIDHKLNNSHNNNHTDTGPILVNTCEGPLKQTVDPVVDSLNVELKSEDNAQTKRPNITSDSTTTNGVGNISTPASESVTPMSSEKEDASTMTSKMLIIDARSYTAAMANRAKGGGCECSEYYQRCEIQFMNLANIHSIRKSYQAIRGVCESYSEQSNNWVSFLDNSRWLHHISGLLKSALLVVDTIDIEEKSILIHCSDGWDRTPQLVALAEIMLDPHYRTFEGFKTLIQREWLDFGHKFADRCGSNPCNEDPNERCPVFLQWLDCVQQLLVQYPRHFEFNSSYLDKLNRHTYSNVFGTFSYNSTQERILSRVDDKLLSLWAYFESSRRRYKNDKYVDNDDILRPSFKVRDLHFWKEVYLPPVRSQASFMPVPDNIDNKKFYDSLYIDGLTRTVCK